MTKTWYCDDTIETVAWIMGGGTQPVRVRTAAERAALENEAADAHERYMRQRHAHRMARWEGELR